MTEELEIATYHLKLCKANIFKSIFFTDIQYIIFLSVFLLSCLHHKLNQTLTSTTLKANKQVCYVLNVLMTPTNQTAVFLPSLCACLCVSA